jgi:hypothetical protein
LVRLKAKNRQKQSRSKAQGRSLSLSGFRTCLQRSIHFFESTLRISVKVRPEERHQDSAKRLALPKPHLVLGERFDNEASWIRTRTRGRLVHVIRPDGNEPVRPHVSESGIAREGAEPEFINADSLDDLHHQIDAWLDHTSLLKRP